jgi:hypothetical protein
MPHANSCLLNGCRQRYEKEDKRVESFALHCGSLATSNPADNRKLFSESWLRAGKSSGDSDVLTNDDYDFRQDWEKFSGMNKNKFEDYFSVDSHVATCGAETVQKLCVSLVASRSVEGEEGGEEDGKPEVVLSFAEMHEALFLYVHSTSDSNRESVLGLEKSYFELRRKVCTKQTSVKDFFQQEVIIIIKGSYL